MKTILLSKGKVAIVNDEDYEWLSQWKWLRRPTQSYKLKAQHLLRGEI